MSCPVCGCEMHSGEQRQQGGGISAWEGMFYAWFLLVLLPLLLLVTR